MKKSVIAIGVGIFIVTTSLLCMNSDEKMYQKQEHFNSVNDVLIKLENNDLEKIENDGRVHQTSEFNECLSKRKRLTFPEMNFQKVEIEKIQELDDEQKKSILEDYNKQQRRLAFPYKPTKIEPMRLDIKGKYLRYAGEKEVSKEYTIDLVMVDEGEGMVIDYYVEHDNENGNVKKEGKVNAKN